MPVGFDNCTVGGGNGINPLTFAHLIGGSNRYLVLFVFTDVLRPTGATYAGVPMTELCTSSISGHDVTLFGLLNPATGNNNVVVNAAGNMNLCAHALSYEGVDQANPVTDDGCKTAAGTTITDTINSGVNDLVVSACSRVAGTFSCDGIVPDAAWVVRCCCTAWVASRSADVPSEGLTTNVTWTLTDNTAIMMAMVSLAPFASLRGRAVDYYFDIWDPLARIRDIQDRWVPNDEILSDRYVEIQGVKLPASIVYDSFVQDPTKSRIIQVDATPEAATMKAARSQIAEILISRAAGGKA